MSDNIYFKTEAIINYPKVKIDKEKFEGLLYFKQSDFDNSLKEAFEDAKKEFKKATCKLKKIEEESPGVLNILDKEYIYQHNINARLEYLKCIDLYKKDIDLNSLQSGDKVYVKGVLRETENPENRKQKYITMYINLIAKVQEKAFDLYDAEKANQDFYDGLDSYKADFDSDSEISSNDKMEWE